MVAKFLYYRAKLDNRCFFICLRALVWGMVHSRLRLRIGMPDFVLVIRRNGRWGETEGAFISSINHFKCIPSLGRRVSKMRMSQAATRVSNKYNKPTIDRGII